MDVLHGNEEHKQNILERVPVRVNYVYEDGEEIKKENLDILKDGEKLSASVLVFPYINPYPSLDDDPVGYSFSCSADKSMNEKIFSNLCAILIEKATLNKQFKEVRRCVWGNDGKFMFEKSNDMSE